MKENDFLRRKWRKTGHDKISEFIRDVKSDLTQETWGAVMNRDKRPDIRTLLIMSVELGCTPEEISKLLIERGEGKIAAIIQPSPATAQEMELIEKLRQLDAAKLKLVTSMIEQLRG